MFGLFDARSSKLLDTSIATGAAQRPFWTFLDVIPNVTLVIVLALGARGGRPGQAHAWARLVAFITLMLSLVWPVSALGFLLSMAQEAMTAADRIAEIFDAENEIADGDAEPRRRARPAQLRRCRLPLTRTPTATCCTTSTCDLAPGETVALVGATGSGKTALTTLVPRLYDVTAGPDHHRRRRRPRPPAGPAAPDRRDRVRGPDPVLDVGAGEPDPRPAGRHRRRDRRGDRGRPGRVRLRPAVGPGHPDRRAGPEPVRRAAAAARAGPRGARPGRRCWCSTTPSPRWTSTPRRWSRRRCAGAAAASPAIVVAHRASTVLLADRVALLSGGTIAHVGTHSELLATVPEYRDLLAEDAREGLDVLTASAEVDATIFEEPEDRASRDGTGRGRRAAQRAARGRVARGRRRERRRARAAGDGVPAPAQPRPARRPAAAVPARCIWVLVAVVVLENAARLGHARCWSARGIDLRHAAAAWRAGRRACAARDRRADARSRSSLQAVSRIVLPARRPAGSARTCCSSCAAGCSPTSSGSTSPFHERYTSGRVIVPADQRHRRDRRAAGERLRRAGHRRADHGRRRRADAHPRPAARRWSA